MQFKDEDGPLSGVALVNTAGELVWAGITNEKGYRKSLENNHLWVLDGKTGRLLPLEELRSDLAPCARLQSISSKDGQVHAVSSLGGSSPEAPRSGNHNASKENHPIIAVGDTFQVLASLEALIQKRKVELPEGSYTTHLFKSGLHKIRKKTGEEAVELVLAKDKAEVTSEAADLIYHMIVLLVEWGVPLEDVMAELRRR